MAFSFFKFDWKKSPAHLYLLTQFISANSKKDFVKSDSWKRILKEDPQKAINRFLTEEMVEQADLRGILDYKYNVSELKEQLKKLGLKQSGKKADLIERLISADENRFKQLQQQIYLLKCTEHGKNIVTQHKENENQKRQDFEARTFRALQQSNLVEASQLVAEYNNQKINLYNIPDDEKNNDFKRNLVLLKIMFNSKPKILKNITDDQLGILQLAAGMMFLWKYNNALKWLPEDFNLDITMDKNAAAHMIYSYALNKEAMALHKKNKMKSIKISCCSNSCDECKKIANKKYTLNQVPEIPYEHCTSEQGCLCTTMGYFS